MHRLSAALASVLLACGGEPTSDAGVLDAPSTDTPGLDVPGLDAPGLDVPGLDAPPIDGGAEADAFEPIDPDAIYIAPNGNDATGDGSMEAPFFTLVRT